MSLQEFGRLMQPVMDVIAGRAVDRTLETELNRRFPAGDDAVRAIEEACHAAIKAGWMCAKGDAKRRFGRVIEPAPGTHDLSVDVVALTDIVGPHHRHPNGEICLVMPVDAGARFNGRGAGWCVFPPGSAHRPAVAGGEALILYMLPGGAIEFTEGRY